MVRAAFVSDWRFYPGATQWFKQRIVSLVPQPGNLASSYPAPLLIGRTRGYGILGLILPICIIGMVTLFTLKGAAMIAPMRTRIVAQQIDRYQSAIVSYVADYNSLPGDDSAAPTRWQRNDAIYQIAGVIVTFTGDGKINGELDDSRAALGEQYFAWSDLRAGGYVEGDPKLVGQSARPENTYGGVFAFAEDNLGLQQVLCLTRVPGRDAGILDRNIDDGKIASGKVRATSQWDPIDAKNHFEKPDDAPYNPDKTYIICLPYMP
jgi:hypothetical protein